jgi:hypothetical protein
MVSNALPTEWRLALDYACKLEGTFSRAIAERGEKQENEISASRMIKLEILVPGIEKAYRGALANFRYRQVFVFTLNTAAGYTKGMVIGVTGQGDWGAVFPPPVEWEGLREEMHVRAYEAHANHKRLEVADIKFQWMGLWPGLIPPILGALVAMRIASDGRWTEAVWIAGASALWFLASVGLHYVFGFLRRRILRRMQGAYASITPEEMGQAFAPEPVPLHPHLATESGRIAAAAANERLKDLPPPEPPPRRSRFPLATLTGSGESRR